MTEDDLVSNLGSPKVAEVVRKDNSALESGVPRYLVRHRSLSISHSILQMLDIRLIDFGESFDNKMRPETLRTPLTFRAPEVIFEDEWDTRVDLWSTGCTVSVAPIDGMNLY